MPGDEAAPQSAKWQVMLAYRAGHLAVDIRLAWQDPTVVVLRHRVRSTALSIAVALTLQLACRSRPPPDAHDAEAAAVPTAAAQSSTVTAALALAPSAVASVPDPGLLPRLPPLPRHAVTARTEACVDEDADAGLLWLDRRLAAARAGRREIVRIGYSVGAFYACSCPTDYLCYQKYPVVFDYDARLHADDLWRGMVPDPSHPAETSGRTGTVEGWIEKDQKSEWYGEGGERKLWKQVVFVPWHASADTSSGGATVVAVLDDDELFVPRLHDDRPWLAVVATLGYEQPHVDDEAAAVRARAVAAGFPDAEVIDSRQTDALLCCSRVVVAGRFPSKADADRAVATASRKGLKGYVRKAW
jgi:hypothetical protein